MVEIIKQIQINVKNSVANKAIDSVMQLVKEI